MKRLFTLLIGGVLLLSLFCGCSSPLTDIAKSNVSGNNLRESIPGPPLHSGGDATSDPTTEPTKSTEIDTTHAGTFYLTINSVRYAVWYNPNNQILEVHAPRNISTFYRGTNCLDYVKREIEESCANFAKALPAERRFVLMRSNDPKDEAFVASLVADAQNYADENGYKIRVLLLGEEQQTTDGLINLETAKLIMSLYWDIPVEDVILLQGLDPNRNSSYYLFSNGTQTRRLEGLNGRVDTIPE